MKVQELKQKIYNNVKIYKLVEPKNKNKPDVYLVPPTTQLTCSTIQVINQQAAKVTDQLNGVQQIFNEAVAIYNQITGLQEHRNYAIQFIQKATEQLNEFSKGIFQKLSQPTQQKIINDSDERSRNNKQKLQFKFDTTASMLYSESNIMQQLRDEIDKIKTCFDSLSLKQNDE